MTLPAHLQGDRRQLGAVSVEGMGMPPAPYISIEGQKFTLIDAAGGTLELPTYGPIFVQRDQAGNEIAVQGSPVGIYLDAVLVDVNHNMSKVYYANPYSGTAQQFMPPDCWSDNGVAPSVGAKNPQSETCQLCKWNEWGSKVNALGNKVRACDDVKKLAWLVPALGVNTAFLLRLKGSSHRNWSSYIEKVSKQSLGTRALDPTDIVTRIYFEPGQIGILNFHWVKLIDAQTAAFEDEIWKARSTDQLVGRNDRPRTAALPAPAQGQQALPVPPAAVAPPPPAPPATTFVMPPPMQPPAPPAQPTFVPPPAPAPQQPAGQAAPTPAPTRRRRQAAQPAQPAAPAAPAQPPQPAFLPPNRLQPAPPPTQPPAPSFGIAQPQAMPSELEAALNEALKPLS